MDRVERPLSPHLQVYRPQMTSVLSILHRATGVALSAGVVVLVYWLVAIAGGSAAYEAAAAILGSGWLKIGYAGWSFCFFYHLANGIRHLAWDVGLGFEMNQINASGWLVLIVASVATAAFVFAAIL
jgi:succinate dehydrogenase / fumarate reductase cytochrome b subunit